VGAPGGVAGRWFATKVLSRLGSPPRAGLFGLRGLLRVSGCEVDVGERGGAAHWDMNDRTMQQARGAEG